MKLQQIVESINDIHIHPEDESIEVSSLSCDSRKTQAGGLFFALRGLNVNGASYIDQAIANGANVVVYFQGEKIVKQQGVCYIAVEDPDKTLRQIGLNFYGNPSKKINAIGITGTNGKTTIAYLIESVLHEAELSCSVIGTVNYRIGEKILPSINTTPGFLDMQKLFFDIANDGVEYCVMEVSSHALDQRRVDHINFNTAVFTNLTSDHLDYHKTRQNYFAAKAKLFSALDSSATSVINVDDEFGPKLFSKTESQILTYGINRNADVMASDISCDINGTSFKLITPEGETQIRTRLIGYFNVYNILAAVGACLAEGVSIEKIKKGIERISLIPGRLEAVDCQQPFSIFIDYAHTQDALENVLKAIRQTSDANILLLFGCGGDRDRSKRAAMAQVACTYADHSIITSDNPRSETPRAIIDEIIEGFENNKYEVVVDREEAIKKALSMAQENEIVLIAGKGHETYQIFKDRTIPFDERKIIRQYLRC